MPFYDYRCTSCQGVFERHLSIHDTDVPLREPCPNCRAKTVVAYFGEPPMVQFKGGGWYKDGYQKGASA